MASYSTHDVVLIPFPFTDLRDAKVRPAIVINNAHPSQDLLLVALTSRTHGLQPGEFILKDWQIAGLNVATAIKRNLGTIKADLVIRKVGHISDADSVTLISALRS